MTNTHPRRPHLTSVTRISDLEQSPYEVRKRQRDDWATGDYVLGEVLSEWHPQGHLELANGREMSPSSGDLVLGTFGSRAATLEAVGDWRDIGDDEIMESMTAAGLFGRITSKSHFLGPVVRLRYLGHACRNGQKLTMRSFVQSVPPDVRFDAPVILIIGTSMSSGKTMSARVLVRLLTRAGKRVVGAKLTGAGRLRDTLAMKDAGAAETFDFVDCGLPSTVCSAETYGASLEILLGRIAEAKPDILVAEAGASPLEPYNGDAAIQRIRPHVKFTVLCASDPYAVVGVTKGFGFQPDLVSGVATSTTAGCRVVETLSGVKALNIQDAATLTELEELLHRHELM
ncbi:MAG: hypothetical protein KDA89_05510 [Planctomycetaceae bacterium]|nr:hypothetical protein [Planctomycetaceae bacterium]